MLWGEMGVLHNNGFNNIFCEVYTMSPILRSDEEIYRFRCKLGNVSEYEQLYHKFPNEATPEITAKIHQSRSIELLKETFLDKFLWRILLK